MTATLLLSAIAAGLASLSGSLVIARHARRLGLIDVPGVRSSHKVPTPRGGGIAIIVGVALAVVILWGSGAWPTGKAIALLSAAILIGVVGAIDDVRSIRPVYRLCIQLLVAVATVYVVGRVDRLPLPTPLDVSTGWLAAPLTVLWLVTVTNFYNFMDGIDGLAVGQAVASCAGVALAGWAAGATDLALILGVAALAFAILNRPPAKLFLGDSGSTFLGFTIAAFPLIAPASDRHVALFAVGVGLALFLLDPLETLARLVAQGQRLGRAHRVHSYQILGSTRRRQTQTAIVISAVGLVLAIFGALSFRIEALQWPALTLGLLAFAGERYLAYRSEASY
jgi:Fuc2NAc and GlcNAc transferase